MNSLDVLEAPLLRVPFDGLKRAAKERKSAVDDVSDALSTLSSAKGKAKDAQAAQLATLMASLQGLKRKLEDVSAAEHDDAQRCKARLAHLRELGLPPKGDVVRWNKGRLDRLVVEHLLRGGHHRSAEALSAAGALGPLVDAHIFADARRILDALAMHDAGPALAWCEDHASKLRRAKSRLEFSLRLQQFVELVRNGERLAAIMHARAHLAPWAPTHMAELQRTVATLAFGPHTTVAPYAELFTPERWVLLRETFLKDLYRLYSLTPESLLTVHLQAGLCALKTPRAYAPGCSKEDPLHLPAFQRLAVGLPYAKHVHSKLVCSLTHEVMSDANPPLVLPNGHVYSAAAVDANEAAHPGLVMCPRTGVMFARDELRRAYVV